MSGNERQMTDATIEDLVRHHPPAAPVVVRAHEDVRTATQAYMLELNRILPECTLKGDALTAALTAMHWANTAIAVYGNADLGWQDDMLSAEPDDKVWECKIGAVDPAQLPRGADVPMRYAIEAAYYKVTGVAPRFNFSGWGGRLTASERAVIEDRDAV